MRFAQVTLSRRRRVPSSCAKTDEAAALVHRIESALCAPFTVDGREILVTASIGVALGPLSSDTETFLAQAGRAMYLAKRADDLPMRFTAATSTRGWSDALRSCMICTGRKSAVSCICDISL